MDSSAEPGQSASGDRSVAAQEISGIVATGDSAAIDARRIALAPGAIPAPDQVSIAVPVHKLPRVPARVFAGREAALRELGGALAGGGSAVVTQAVYGLGGVGKSELALHHASPAGASTGSCGGLPRPMPGQVQAGLAGLAARLCPPIAVAGTTEDAAGWATGWLQAHDGWLLMLDNVEDPGDVEPLLALPAGHVVLTTRRDVDWQRMAVPVRLEVLAPGPAAEVITARTGHTTSRDGADALAVAAELGFLPLALDQAAAYIIQARITLDGTWPSSATPGPDVRGRAGQGGCAANDNPVLGHHHRRHRRPGPGRDRGCCRCWPLRAR